MAVQRLETSGIDRPYSWHRLEDGERCIAFGGNLSFAVQYVAIVVSICAM